MKAKIILDHFGKPLYSAPTNLVSFISYSHAPLCVVVVDGSYQVHLSGACPAYVYYDHAAIIISSVPLESIPKFSLVAHHEAI